MTEAGLRRPVTHMGRIYAVVMSLVGAWGLAVLSWYGFSLPRANQDAVGQLKEAFSESKPLIPISGTLGYVSSSAPSVSDGEIRFIAQYALAPRVLLDDLTNQHVAIAPPSLDSARHAAMLASGWTDSTLLPHGVRVYRR